MFSCRIAIAAFVLAPTILAQTPEPEAEARLLRYPHMQGDKIAFVHGGDIWTASANGGTAHRITSFDDGLELFPRISPDGNWVAFSGEYSGTRQIYLVPYSGGEPRQLTFYPDVGPMPPRGGYDHLPLDWTPDGKHILIRANRTPYGKRVGRYFLVDPWNGGLETPLQIPEGGPASLSPDGRKVAYNIISREWRTWKRYKAGRAQDVFLYDLDTNTVEQITDFAGTDNFPMWLGNRVYYTSDRAGGTLNLWRYDVGSKQTTQVTNFTDWDVLFPSRGAGGVIFEAGGHLHVMAEGTEAVRKLAIRLGDDKPWLRPVWKDGKRGFGGFAPSPSGKRCLVEFRGEIFSAPKEHGEVRNLTRTPNRRERSPDWSPDGKTITYLAEAGDDYELFARDAASGEERQLTNSTGAWILDYAWSPDSKRIAFSDKRNRLMVLDVASGSLHEVDRGAERGISQWSFSADSHWMTYVKRSVNGFNSVWISSVDDPKPTRVTTDRYRDNSPTFDPKGRYLYFASARDYKHDGYEFESRMYALTLRRDVEHPLGPRSDEEEIAADAEEDDEAPEEEQPAEEEEDDDRWAIDLDGIADRIVALPGSPSSYRGLVAVEKGLLFSEGGKLRHFDLEARESKVVLDLARGFVLTPDQKQLFYRHSGNLCYAKVSPGQKLGKDKVRLDGMRVRIVPRDEWAQMYGDAWRIMRDWFYDPRMHAVDWLAMRAKYAPLVAHASHRSDLDFLISELIGELNCGHTYVNSGELPSVERVPVGLLGCEFEVVEGAYRIQRIYPGENWNERTRSPLTEPGLDVKEGDFLVAIDDHDVRAPRTPFHYLENTVGRDVTLLVNDTPTREGARSVVVKPIASELGLRNLAWTRRNLELVTKLSNGRIGYVHVPNTAIDGHRELFKHFRPQARVCEAMIIDDRYNGGGFVPSDMAFSLGQPVLNYWARREAQLDTTPQFAFEGPMTMLINGYSSSGGDAFPYYFRKLGLGKLIGKKTWGGLVGYSGSPRLLDGGGMAVPSFAFVNVDGEWDVEAVGVAPDIEVFDDPSMIQAGREPVLEAAVEHLLRELETRKPAARPPTPAGPDRRQ